jgi:hypothetical protein
MVVPPRVVPPLPYPGDAGSITGWLVDQSTSITSSSLVGEVEMGFARLSHNIPDPLDQGYAEAMRDLVDEVTNSADLCCYLTMSDTGSAVLRVVCVHFIGKYSVRFGALSAFQGTIMAFLGETIGTTYPS